MAEPEHTAQVAVGIVDDFKPVFDQPGSDFYRKTALETAFEAKRIEIGDMQNAGHLFLFHNFKVMLMSAITFSNGCRIRGAAPAALKRTATSGSLHSIAIPMR